MNVLRTLRTVRHLRAIQVVDRLTRGARRRLLVPLSDATSYRLVPRAPVPQAAPRKEVVLPEGFRFLHLPRTHRGGDRWNPVATPRLWTYHLHYFRYLPVVDRERALAMIEDWIRSNPPYEGPGWEPYTLSLRLREWTEWILEQGDTLGEHRASLVSSLADQANALAGQIEHHLLGNHLLENAITLCWMGCSLEGPRAQTWLAKGTKLLQRELASQVLGDGTHDERSPMYQSILAEALLRLAEVASASGASGAESVVAQSARAGRAMLGSLADLSHPDGEIALLNDAAFGEAPTVGALGRRFGGAAEASLETTQGPVVWSLPDAGYHGARWREGYLVFDGGPLGPDHQPGHGHADALSFELSHQGERLVTDTGVFTYEAGPIRTHDRSTAAHSTIQVDGCEQAELWGAFRCGRRPRVSSSRGVETADGISLGARIEGIPCGGGVEHERKIAVKGGRISFLDLVRAPGPHVAVSRLPLAPGVTAAKAPAGWVLRAPGGAQAELSGSEEWKVVSMPYHPEFGVEVERACLEARVEFRDALTLPWDLHLAP